MSVNINSDNRVEFTFRFYCTKCECYCYLRIYPDIDLILRCSRCNTILQCRLNKK